MIAVPVAGRAGERHPVDAGMLGEELARPSPAEAVHDVVDPGGHAGLGQHLGQQRRRRRRLLRGLTTTALPHARAGATFQVSSSSGRFHGTITATTPSGLRTA